MRGIPARTSLQRLRRLKEQLGPLPLEALEDPDDQPLQGQLGLRGRPRDCVNPPRARTREHSADTALF